VLIDIVVLLLIGIGAVRGAVQGIAKTLTDLLGLLLGIPLAFRIGGAAGDLAFSGFAPVYGRTLGAVIVLAVLGAIVGRVAARSFGPPLDLVDQAGGVMFGMVRGVVFATMAIILVSGVAGSSGSSGYTTDSVFGDFVTDPDSWPLPAFAAATGDTQLAQAVAFNHEFPGGPVVSDGFQLLPATALSDLERDPEAGVQITLLVNEAREVAGLPMLTWSAALTDVATAYATEMATEGFFSHNSPTTGDVGDRLTDAGIGFRTAGENLAWGPTVDRVHTGLMNSPTHRANILNSQFRNVGIGVMRGPLGLMVVQVFQR
jgi:uncharacterized protein YkwD/uncharacterized membrane protein required for colicin V production